MSVAALSLYALWKWAPLLASLALLLAALEGVTVGRLLGTPVRTVFVLTAPGTIASLLSLLGILALRAHLLAWQTVGCSAAAVHSNYRPTVLPLVAAWFVVSLSVSALFLLPRVRVTHRTSPGGRLVRFLFVGNALNYGLLGAAFCFLTRPTFGASQVTLDTRWTRNPGEVLYFIERPSAFIKRIRADGGGQTTLVPFKAVAFLVSGDQQTFIYRGVDDLLYVYDCGAAGAVRVPGSGGRLQMQTVSLSGDKRLVAYLRTTERQQAGRMAYTLHVFNVNSCSSFAGPPLTIGNIYNPKVSWSADGATLFVERDSTHVAAVQGSAPWSVTERLRGEFPQMDELAVNYVWCGTGRLGDRPFRGEDRRGSYTARMNVFPGSLDIIRGDEVLLRVMDDYGGAGPPMFPSFLPNGLEVLLEWWGGIYLLDIERERLGLLSRGTHYVMPTNRFRIAFERNL